MSHKPIILSDISLFINQKTCFEHFSTQIHPGRHIVIIGSNGTGKSTLLKIIQGILPPTQGTITLEAEIVFGYVAQTITDYPQLSGGQRFNKALSHTLSLEPDVLCLDEPTNHLDLNNKRSLIGMLQKYKGTLLVASHDPEVLTLDFDEIWHIEHGTITVFQGNYAAYLKEHAVKQHFVKQQRERLEKEKNQLRKMIEKERKRTAQSKAANQFENDRNLLVRMKETGSHTAGRNSKKLAKAQEIIQQKLVGNFVHKHIEPKFTLDAAKLALEKSVVYIVDGSCGYKEPILNTIYLQVKAADRIAIIGDNGTGKSTFIKAVLRDPSIVIDGQWLMPTQHTIGYLDQHYANLEPQNTVIQAIEKVAPDWDNLHIRKHLNDFLFSTQEQVTTKVAHLSGGEKARLSLAFIAAQSPYLLLLDEITNNVDLATREHIIQVLQKYPGAMIIVSHDLQFLQALSVHTIYQTNNGKLEVSYADTENQ